MRIAIDIKHFKHGYSGIARYLRSIMDRLQEIDHENEYLLFESKPSDYAIYNNHWKKYLIQWDSYGIIWQQIILPFHLRKHKVDVLWAPEQTRPILFLNGIRTVTTIHDLVFIHYPETCQRKTHYIFSILTPFIMRYSDALVTVSDYIKNDIIKTFHKIDFGNRIISIPNGKPDWKIPLSYSPTQRQDYLFVVGNLEPRKNLTALFLAIKILKNRGLNIKLQLAGPIGWKNSKVLELLKSREYNEQITYLGYIDEQELISKYLNCKALIYPSVYEGFGLPVLEALCLDCLVLTSKGTVMEEIAGDCAIYFNPYNPEDIADAIEKIFAPEFERNKYLGIRKENVLASYSWDVTARKLLDVIRKIGNKSDI